MWPLTVAVALSGCFKSRSSAAALPPFFGSAATIGPVAAFCLVACGSGLLAGKPDGRCAGSGCANPELVAAGADQLGVAALAARGPQSNAAATSEAMAATAAPLDG